MGVAGCILLAEVALGLVYTSLDYITVFASAAEELAEEVGGEESGGLGEIFL